MEATEEEVNPDSLIHARGKGLHSLKVSQPEVFDKLVSGHVQDVQKVQKLSTQLEKMTEEESAKLLTETMKIKQEAISTATSVISNKGMPASSLSLSTPIHLLSTKNISPLP